MTSKTNYNPNIHNRRSIRKKGYDYTQAGMYFITICCQDRACLLGEIVDKKMKLNDAGQMVEKWYYELENKFPDIKCHEMVVMPNHFHCIIENVGPVSIGVGADLRVCPNTVQNTVQNPKNEHPTTEKDEHKQNILGEHKQNILDEHKQNILDEHKQNILDEHKQNILGEHVGSPLRVVVQWFKTMATNEYIRGVKNLCWKPFNGKLWQRNYYEHIIRDQKSYDSISEYIINNQ